MGTVKNRSYLLNHLNTGDGLRAFNLNVASTVVPAPPPFTWTGHIWALAGVWSTGTH